MFTDPFALLADLERSFDRMLVQQGTARAGWLPAADVVADEHELRVYMDAPGMREEDIRIEVDDGTLVISGERRPLDVSGTNAQRIERGWGRWSRSLRLPSTIEFDRVSASLDDGVLTVRLPIAEAARPRQIPIAVGGQGALEGEADAEPIEIGVGSSSVE